jgi:hypothetical protein
MLAALYEDAVDVAARDPAAAQMILSRAVTEMVTFVFAKAGRFIPPQKDLLGALTAVDSHVAELAGGFFEASELETRLELAGEIADRTIGARGFFEWETLPDPVADEG